MLKAGDYIYVSGHGYGTVKKVNADTACVMLEDYDNMVKEVDLRHVYSSADEEYNEWFKSWQEYKDRYPEKPI